MTLTENGAQLRTAGAPHAWDLSWSAPGEAECGDGRLQVDGIARGPGWLTVLFDPVDEVDVTLLADASERETLDVPPSTDGLGRTFWTRTAQAISLTSTSAAHRARAEHLSAALPFFAHNALIHYLSPRGLEPVSYTHLTLPTN